MSLDQAQGPGNPPKEPPITCGEYLCWFLEQNFADSGKYESGAPGAE